MFSRVGEDSDSDDASDPIEVSYPLYCSFPATEDVRVFHASYPTYPSDGSALAPELVGGTLKENHRIFTLECSNGATLVSTPVRTQSSFGLFLFDNENNRFTVAPVDAVVEFRPSFAHIDESDYLVAEAQAQGSSATPNYAAMRDDDEEGHGEAAYAAVRQERRSTLRQVQQQSDSYAQLCTEVEDEAAVTVEVKEDQDGSAYTSLLATDDGEGEPAAPTSAPYDEELVQSEYVHSLIPRGVMDSGRDSNVGAEINPKAFTVEDDDWMRELVELKSHEDQVLAILRKRIVVPEVELLKIWVALGERATQAKKKRKKKPPKATFLASCRVFGVVCLGCWVLRSDYVFVDDAIANETFVASINKKKEVVPVESSVVFPVELRKRSSSVGSNYEDSLMHDSLAAHGNKAGKRVLNEVDSPVLFKRKVFDYVLHLFEESRRDRVVTKSAVRSKIKVSVTVLHQVMSLLGVEASHTRAPSAWRFRGDEAARAAFQASSSEGRVADAKKELDALKRASLEVLPRERKSSKRPETNDEILNVRSSRTYRGRATEHPSETSTESMKRRKTSVDAADSIADDLDAVRLSDPSPSTENALTTKTMRPEEIRAVRVAITTLGEAEDVEEAVSKVSKEGCLAMLSHAYGMTVPSRTSLPKARSALMECIREDSDGARMNAWFIEFSRFSEAMEVDELSDVDEEDLPVPPPLVSFTRDDDDQERDDERDEQDVHVPAKGDAANDDASPRAIALRSKRKPVKPKKFADDMLGKRTKKISKYKMKQKKEKKKREAEAKKALEEAEKNALLLLTGGLGS